MPSKVCTGKWLWYSAEDNGYPHFDGFLTVMLDHDFYPTEAAAFAALGFALRAVKQFARGIPG